MLIAKAIEVKHIPIRVLVYPPTDRQMNEQYPAKLLFGILRPHHEQFPTRVTSPCSPGQGYSSSPNISITTSLYRINYTNFSFVYLYSSQRGCRSSTYNIVIP